MDTEYNYVVFEDNTNPFYKTTLGDLYSLENVKVFCPIFDDKPAIVQELFRFHVSERVLKRVRLPFKSFWNRHIFKDSFNNDKPICFLFSSSLYKLRWTGYFEYLRKNYKGCKFVYYCRDLFDWYFTRYYKFDFAYLKNTFDLILTYDILDSIKYDLVFYPDFESMVIDGQENNDSVNQVLFIGSARNRLRLILDVYQYLTINNIKCDFYITGVPKEDRIESSGLCFADKWLPYSTVIDRTKHSSCILEIVQNHSAGYSARAMKAIGYNKKLISNAIAIRHTRFYDGKNIQYIDKPSDIDINCLLNNSIPNYGYRDEFSPVSLINFVDEFFASGITPEQYYHSWFDLVGYKEDALLKYGINGGNQ